MTAPSSTPLDRAATPQVARPRLLVVDDEPGLRQLASDYLGSNGYDVLQAADAAQARALFEDWVSTGSGLPALVLLDLNMPGENGLSLTRWLRERHPRLGLLMLTAAADAVDRVVGLELGADDYLTKPFEPRELLARIRAVLRRLNVAEPAIAIVPQVPASVGHPTPPSASASPVSAGQLVAFGHCILDLAQRRLLDAQGQDLPLTAAEFDLLALFARHPNRPLNRDQIMAQAHQRDWDVFDRSIDLRIMRLRRKVEPNPDKPSVIKTVRNVGYVFVPD